MAFSKDENVVIKTCDNEFFQKFKAFFSEFEQLSNCDKKMLLKAFMPKIIVHVDFRIEIKVNPVFYEMFENTGLESEKTVRANKKWLVGSRSSELFTPSAFLTDIIEFSGIRPEEDLSSLS